MTRKPGGYVLAIALLLCAMLAVLGASLLELAPSQLSQSQLVLELGRMSDLAQCGLSDAEARLLANPAWSSGVPRTPFESGSYEVTLVSRPNGPLLRASGHGAGGEVRVLEREIGLGSRAFQYAVYSAGTLTLDFAPKASIEGGLYGYQGVLVSEGDHEGVAESFVNQGPEIRLPSVDRQRYRDDFGFDLEFASTASLEGDYSGHRIVFVDGNLTLRQDRVPFRFRTLIVTGNVVISGKLPGSSSGNSWLRPRFIDGARRLPALLCGGNLSTDGQPVSELEVEGTVWVSGNVTLEELQLEGNLMAGGNVTLTGQKAHVHQRPLLWDPMSYPPYFTPDAAGCFLTRVRQRIVQ
ncbi:MAG: hypothetical protein HYY25_16965 [Candidatus Wallbacteria bacterium]|nr:hypothetical protein [Candidatus Wallbacteria bacterium]